MHNHNSRWRLALLGIASFTVTASGCHRVIIDSGLQPSPQIHHEEWNQAFAHAIYPAQLDASGYCGGRWARVETKQSFLNAVVEVITLGIISPMDVKVVCAEPHMSQINAPSVSNDGNEDRRDAQPPATENGARR